MKFTVFIVLLTISTSWGVKSKIEDPKDKREAASGNYLPQSSQSYQPQSSGQEESNAISIGAGYSVGGAAKPTYSFAGPAAAAGVGASYQLQPESGHGNIQLAPASFQANGLVSNDLSQLMSQISQGLNSGAISLPSSGSHGAIYQFAGQGNPGAQEISVPQFSYGNPQLQQYSLAEPSQGAVQVPAYAIGTKGLGTYGSKGPVLFSPESNGQGALSYAAPSFGQSYQAAVPLGDAGHSFPGFSFSGSGQSLGGSLKGFNGNYATPVGKSAFKPSAFLGATVSSELGGGLGSLSGSHGSPSFAAYQLQAGGHGAPSFSSGGHGASFGSLASLSGGPSKAVAASYLPTKYEGVGSLESISSAFSASGQIAAPGTTYGSPSGAYSNNVHAASAPSPAYYISGKHSSPTFGPGSSSFRGPAGHTSLHSFSSGPKYSFGGGHGSRYAPAPKDAQGSYSESNYNTIKYSEELKPRFN